MGEIFVNGKFTLQRLTGVQRVASEVLLALDRRLARDAAAPRCTLLLPPDAQPPALAHIATRTVPGPRQPHAWEQWSLPRAARGGTLLNLAGSAPAWAGAGQACVMHDAAVFDVHEAYARAFVHWYRWLFRHLARRDTTLLTVSAFSQGRLAQALGVPPARLSVLPLGADHLARTAPDTSILQAHGLADRPFLLAVGSANPNKGLARLARAWAALARDDARLVVAGGVDAKVFADAALPEVPGLVNVGPVGDAALRALYEAACGLVFPSRYEGFGLPPLEAMACGCPVAASQAASLPEACGDAALMLDPADDGAVLHAMRTLLDDAATRQRLRRAGLAWSARWRWDATADALLRALEPGR